jgi:mono/diheme cytochrome c family protein
VLLALSSAQKLGIGLMAAAFVVFALISAMLVPRYRPDFPAKRMGWFIAACVVFTVGMLGTIVFVAKETEQEAAAETHLTETTTTETTDTTETETTATGGGAAAGSDAAGMIVFTTNCGSCHTLADAGTTGSVGPNLDDLKPAYAVVVEQVTNGGGAMPPFGGTLTEQQIADVAAYVSSVAGT